MRRLLFHLRRLIAAHYGLLLALGAGALLARGFFERLQLTRACWLQLGAAGILGVVVLLRGLLGSSAVDRSPAAQGVERLESGLLLLGALFTAVQVTGGPESWLQPTVYLAMAYLVGFNDRWVGVLLIVGALAFQTTIHVATGELPQRWQPLATRALFLLIFSLANLVLLQTEVTRRRREHKQRLAADLASMREEARDFRLISSALSSPEQHDRAQAETKLATGAVESIHQGMFFVLELLKKSLDLQTCVLLWLDSSEQRLRIKELVSDSSLVKEVPIAAQAGALGGVIKNRILLNLRTSRHGSRGIPYYAGPEQVGAFLGVPVVEGTHLRGVLCADRREDRPFTPAEEQLVVEATRQVLRAIQTERVFAAVERSKYEHERFYSASTMLNSALTLTQVYDTSFAAAREIADFDFGALTLFDRQRRKHIICRVLGERAERFEGREFGENAGLVAMVVKNKHFLPAGDDVRERDTMVFTPKLRMRGVRSLVVLPLIVQDNAIGTFVFASRQSGRYSKKTREMLGVISNQVAVSIENAKMYKRMEEMATTDGLTALPNHRTFQSRLSEMLHRAERHGKPLAVVITDIDKFKLVNDTYGHPVGDAVLRRVSKVLAEQVRKVDLVARYGGEEFAMVLEETDARGAQLFCERVRQEVAAQLMSSEKGSFRVTISLGIAAYPEEGKEKELLIERADQALYAAKQGGRNRTMRFGELHRGRAANI
jgi:two-component system, cell cycle response regulator